MPYLKIERVQILLPIAMLALTVAWFLGKAVELTGQHRQYQANTVNDRAVLSTIIIGLRVVGHHRISLTTNDIASALYNIAAHTVA